VIAKNTFVIGANGVGKTTVMAEVQKLLSGGDFELHDFDERGVPDNADKAWRISETQHWILVGRENKEKGISTIIFGFSKPEEIGTEAEIILLDANERTMDGRIKSRYLTEESLLELNRTTGKTVEKFVMDNVYVSSLLRKSCASMNCKMVTTDDRTTADIAQEVVAKL